MDIEEAMKIACEFVASLESKRILIKPERSILYLGNEKKIFTLCNLTTLRITGLFGSL